jgi:hypothetical protein
MYAKDILNFVDTQPSTTKEVFASVSNSESSATRNAAIAAATNVAKQINDGVGSPGSYIKKIDIETFMAFASDWSQRDSNTFRFKFFVEPFKPLSLRLLGYMYDLNGDRLVEMSNSKESAYYEVGDGIVLAGLYLWINQPA